MVQNEEMKLNVAKCLVQFAFLLSELIFDSFLNQTMIEWLLLLLNLIFVDIKN